MPPRSGTVWDHKSDKDLLLSIIETGALKGIDWKAISDGMVTKGYTFSAEACRYVTFEFTLIFIPINIFLFLSLHPSSQHFQKIRKEARNDSTTSGPTTPSTPSKPSASKPKASSQKRSKGQLESDYGPMGDDDEIITPSKRAKLKAEPKMENYGQENRGLQNATLFKMEDLSGENVIDLDRDE